MILPITQPWNSKPYGSTCYPNNAPWQMIWQERKNDPSCYNYNMTVRVKQPDTNFQQQNLSLRESYFSDPKNVTHNNVLKRSSIAGINVNDTSYIVHPAATSSKETPGDTGGKVCRPDTTGRPMALVTLNDGIWIARINNNSTVSPYVDGVTIVFGDTDPRSQCDPSLNQGVTVVLADSVNISDSEL